MHAYVLLNLFNELRKRDKLSLFRNEFNKLNDTGARMLDSVYYITLRLPHLTQDTNGKVTTSQREPRGQSFPSR